MIRKSLLAAAILLSLIATQCEAERLYVDRSASGSVHDGSSWSRAFLTISDAVDAASIGTEIWVKTGEYHEPPLALNASLMLYGGFLGYENRQEDRVLGAFPTIIDVDRQGSVIAVEGGSDCIIDGFTLRNGCAENGGGIHGKTDSITRARNCRIEFCEAVEGGGGIYFDKYANAINVEGLVDCVVADNKAAWGGGVVIEYHSTAILRRCLIVRNHATGDGGGLYCPFHCDGRIFDCTLAFNSAGTSSGGAYVHYGGDVWFFDSIFAFNSAPTMGGIGGGGGQSSLHYYYCDLFRNKGGDWGGNIDDPEFFVGNYSIDPVFLTGIRPELHLAADIDDSDRAASIGVLGTDGYPPEDVLTCLVESVTTNSDGMKVLGRRSVSDAYADNPFGSEFCMPKKTNPAIIVTNITSR